MMDAPRAHLLRLGFVVLLAALLSACGGEMDVSKQASAENRNASAPLPVIPMPAHVKRSSGQFVVRAGVPVEVSGSKKANAIAQRFTALVARTRHIRLDVKPLGNGDHDGAIVLDLDPDSTSAPAGEGYELTVNDDNIVVTAKQPAGLYYGTVTLWQLLTAGDLDKPEAVVPAVQIKDQPRFAWRGMMLDSGRHFESVAEIKKLIDWMSLHKLNVFHWHLTEDQGWRLQIKQYPKLTEIGSCRKAVGPDAALTGGPDKPYCGFYTQADAREVVQYAAEHFITVVPEIEIPGHSQAAIASYPDLGVTGKRPPVSTKWGITPWLYAPNQHSLHFLENVLDEVMAIFPSKYIHVGGDEAPKSQWKASPKARAKRKELGLKDMDALQGWMVGQIGDYLAKHGRKLVGWDEILQGPVPSDATIMSWRGIKGGIKAANMGHDVILAPSPRLYLDYQQSDADDQPPGPYPVMTLHHVYTFNPVPDQISSAQAKHVIGIQTNLWTEYMPTFKRDQHAIFPRLAAVAELAWSPTSAVDWNSFLARLPDQIARYRALGIHYADSAFAPRFKLEPAANGKVKVRLRKQVTAGTIHYTTDGSAPTSASSSYDEPLVLEQHTPLKATTFDSNDRPLSAPRTQEVTTAALLTRNSSQMAICGKNSNDTGRRLEDDRPLDGPRPVYHSNIFNMCWQWKNAPVGKAKKIAITVGNLLWNFAVPNNDDDVVIHPQSGDYPSLEVHVDGCDGRRVENLSLKKASQTKRQTTLTANLPKMSGKHDLCFIVTGDPRQSFWGIDTVRLKP